MKQISVTEQCLNGKRNPPGKEEVLPADMVVRQLKETYTLWHSYTSAQLKYYSYIKVLGVGKVIQKNQLDATTTVY